MTFGAVNFVDGVINFRLGVAGFGGGSAVITAGPNADAISTVAGFTSATAGNSIVLNHPSLSIGTTVNNTTLTLGGVISGVSGGINAVSSATGGKLVLNNAETYGGETKVTTGTLQLGAAGSIANSSGVNVVGGTFDVSLVSFTLGASQTLKGAGTVSGAVAVNGTLAPGNSAAGILTFNNTLTLNSTAQLAYELAGGNTTPGGSVNDLVTGVSNLTLDGTLNVTEIGAGSFLAAVGGNKWRLFTYAGTLTDNTLVLGTMPALADPSYSFAIDTSTSGQVNLSVVPEPSVLWLLSASAGLVLGGRSWLRRRA